MVDLVKWFFQAVGRKGAGKPEVYRSSEGIPFFILDGQVGYGSCWTRTEEEFLAVWAVPRIVCGATCTRFPPTCFFEGPDWWYIRWLVPDFDFVIVETKWGWGNQAPLTKDNPGGYLKTPEEAVTAQLLVDREWLNRRLTRDISSLCHHMTRRATVDRALASVVPPPSATIGLSPERSPL